MSDFFLILRQRIHGSSRHKFATKQARPCEMNSRIDEVLANQKGLEQHYDFSSRKATA